MHCRNCGIELPPGAVACTRCGVRPLAGRKFCQECGAESRPAQEFCLRCGVRLVDLSGLSEYYREEFQRIYESHEGYKGKWNWAALLFGAVWALTKGVWLAPLIALVGGLITHGLVLIVYWFVFAARGNYMYYMAHVKGKQIPV
ncbi:MAG TPA: zinc ribbon domain-containing protein [Methylomirabilota bacterium]|nr:zinc ribbon domain-containing protein [Methylomirabilota bacterium]